MYVKCQTACVVWCSLTRNLLPLVTAFHGKNCFGTCLGYHYLHRQKCKIEPENDAFQQGISFTTGGAFSGSMQVPCWFLQGCSPDVFPKKNGTIFDDLCKTSASFLHTVAQWHGRLTRRPPGSIFPTDVFSGSKVLERERESFGTVSAWKTAVAVIPINFTPESSKPGFLWKKMVHLFYR